MAEENKHPFVSQKNPWSNNDNNIWIASTISISRNIDKFNFPGKLSLERRKQIINVVEKEFLENDFVANPQLIKVEETSPLEKEFLVEHFLTTQSFQQAHSGEAFIVDDTGEFLAVFNMNDHIQLQLTDCREELENTWNRVVKIETILGKSLNYCFSPKFGFLTADPTQCGTGLIVSIYLQIPGLSNTGKLNEVFDNHQDLSISMSGLHGSPFEVFGDLLVLRNNYTLGVTEESIISSMRTFATKMVQLEKKERVLIKKQDNPEMKDKVSRAFGLLSHSYQIEAIEALSAVSLLKLGVDLGWVTGITHKNLNDLFFKCRRAHLLYSYQEKIPQEEIYHKRAEFIHQVLKPAKLTI